LEQINFATLSTDVKLIMIPRI